MQIISETGGNESEASIRVASVDLRERDDRRGAVAHAALSSTTGAARPLTCRAPGNIVVGASAAMRNIMALIERVAPLPVPVLLLGETGVGKDVFARMIHASSRRPDGPFVPVNVAAIPSELMESTMFGHERGAFTGAVTRQTGKLAQACGGTLFLDEIGEMRMELQAKMLRFLQDKEYELVGGSERLRTDARLVCATNVDIADAVEDGKFRRDLFFRINVVQIRIPPLRERIEDLDALLDAFCARFAREFHRPVTGVSGEAMRLLRNYRWPGNVRELENRVQRAVALACGSELGPEDFFGEETVDAGGFIDCFARGLGTLDSLEETYIRYVLARTTKQSDAARVLGIDRKTLYTKMRQYGMPLARMLADDDGKEERLEPLLTDEARRRAGAAA